MAAGTVILHKRKAGAFSGGELAAGEFGVDTTNGDVYFSTNGSTVTLVGGGGGSTGWTLIDEGTAASVSTLVEDGIFTDTYDEYQLVLIGAKIDTDTAALRLKLRASGSDLTDNYALAVSTVNTGGGAPSTVSYTPANGQPFWSIYGADGTSTDEYCHTIIHLWPRLGLEQRMLFQSNSRDYNAVMAHHSGAGWIPGVTSDIDGFKITTSSEGSYTLDITLWRLFGR